MSQAYAQIEMRRRTTLIGAMTIHRGDADGMLCGTFGTHELHRQYIDQVIGLRRGVRNYAAMNALMLPNRTMFIADTYVNADPTAEQVAEITLLAADEMRRFGIDAEGRAAVALELRLVDAPAGEEDAGGAGADQRDGPGPRGRGRDARRRRAERGGAAAPRSPTRA